MSESLPHTRSSLRQLLLAVLSTPADFDAYCGDFFPEVAARFTVGQDRVQRTNLLLEMVAPDRITEALRMHHPQRYQRQASLIHSSSQVPSGNPYRGLAAFQLDDAHLFFGREQLTERLWERLKALHEDPASARLLAILGPSGSGKSSVARAGLLAALKASPIPEHQPVCAIVIKPGEHPLRTLALALWAQSPTHSASPDLSEQRKLIAELSQTNHQGEFDGLSLWAANLFRETASLLVVLVDQIEELYTLCRDKKERDAFVSVLLHAAMDRSRHVAAILTLRSDFLGETQRHHPELNRLIAVQHELVPALSDEELRQVIAEPARRSGHELDTATIELLVNEARGSEGALPLLEFALTRIWEGLRAGQEAGVTLLQLGGVGGALAGEAQKAYGSLSRSEQATARRALVRLVQPGEGTHDTRRRSPLRELCGQGQTEDDVLAVLRKFAEDGARMVSLWGDGSDTIAEITHEALFVHWTELRHWIDQGRADRRFHDRGAEAARLWSEAGRPAGRLWRPPDLELLREYRRRQPAELGPQLESFLNASLRRQQRDIWMTAGAVLLVLAALLIAAELYVLKERQRSQEVSAAKEQIHEQLLDSYVERGRQLLLENGNPSEGLLWLHRAQGEGSKDPALPHLLKSAMQGVDAGRAVLLGHRAGIYSGLFSPDGRNIVTASADHTARVWHAEGGQLLFVLKGHASSVLSAIYSPDGRKIVTTSSDHTARVWTAHDGELGVELKGHSDEVISAAFSPDGHMVATASSDHTARVWDADSGRLIVELKGHQGRVLTAAFSPNGRSVVTASDDSTARIWTAAGGLLLAELKGHTARVNSATYDPDGHYILTASDDNTARIWASDGGRLRTELKGHGDRINSATYSPDGHYVLTASDDCAARIWDADEGRLRAELKGHGDSVMNAKFSPDGRRILTASWDNTARLWDAGTGQLLSELRGHADSVMGATISPDGRRILTASWDATARLWDAEGGRVTAELKGHAGRVNRAEFRLDGHRMVTASDDSTALVWDVGSGQLLARLAGHTDRVWSAAFSPDGRRILTASWDHTAGVWDAEAGRLLTVLRGHESRINSAAFSLDGHRVLTSSDDNTARLWDAESGRLITALRGHTARVWSAVFSPDGRRVLTASWDDTARIWDAESGRQLANLDGHEARINSAVFSPDGQRVLTASSDTTARIWNAEDGMLLQELKGHSAIIWSATFSPDGRRALTASSDKRVSKKQPELA